MFELHSSERKNGNDQIVIRLFLVRIASFAQKQPFSFGQIFHKQDFGKHFNCIKPFRFTYNYWLEYFLTSRDNYFIIFGCKVT